MKSQLFLKQHLFLTAPSLLNLLLSINILSHTFSEKYTPIAHETLYPFLIIASMIMVGSAYFVSQKQRSFLLALFIFGSFIAINSLSIYSERVSALHQETFYSKYLSSYTKGSNLRYGYQLAKKMLQNSEQHVSQYRMPVYILFCAFVLYVTNVDLENECGGLVAIILFQILFTAIAFSVFFVLSRYLFPKMVFPVVLFSLLMISPHLTLTQVDALILGCGLLMLAVLAFYYRRMGQGKNDSSWIFLLVHMSFLIYYMMRSDILLAWTVIAVCLHKNRLRYILIPVSLFVLFSVTCSYTSGTYVLTRFQYQLQTLDN